MGTTYLEQIVFLVVVIVRLVLIQTLIVSLVSKEVLILCFLQIINALLPAIVAH